ncbi:6747_t:CDS:2, partial [Gigaspora margarita]
MCMLRVDLDCVGFDLEVLSNKMEKGWYEDLSTLGRLLYIFVLKSISIPEEDVFIGVDEVEVIGKDFEVFAFLLLVTVLSLSPCLDRRVSKLKESGSVL